MRPWCRTRIRSAAWTVERRCAIVMLVRPARSPVIACRMSASDSGSTLDIASSRTRTAGLYTRARAMARSWGWPGETLARSVRDVGAALAQELAEPLRQARDEAGAGGREGPREVRGRYGAVGAQAQIL